MRVAFIGKGGSGKTTIGAGFIRYLQLQGGNILAIDADHNVHLKNNLNLPAPPLSLGENYQLIATYLEGSRVEFSGMESIPTVGTIPPSKQSRFITLKDDDEFLSKFSSKSLTTRLLEVGGIKEKDAGNDCYHSKLNALELVIHRLLDTENDYVVADATAGMDHLGTSLFFAYDLNIFVVEPTQKSINVYLDYEKAGQKLGINVYALVNKVTGSQDINFVQKQISPQNIIATVKYSRDIQRFEQGETSGFNLFVKRNKDNFAAIDAKLKSIKRDWKAYYTKLLKTYEAECKDWWNDYYNMELHKIKDPSFSYKNISS